MAEPSIRNTRHFGNPLFREIHKNSWLTKIPSVDQKKKKERVWIVFCVHDDTEAFLEGYTDNKTAVLHKPEWFISLNATRHVSPTICPHEQEFEFVVTLVNEIVRLAAPSWEAMLDWVESLRGKLLELKILTPKENLYSKLPETHASALLPTRDPTSPLPPPPAVPPGLLPGIERLPSTTITHLTSINSESSSRLDISNSALPNRRHPLLQRGVSLPEHVVTPAAAVTIIQVDSQSREPDNDVFTFDVSLSTSSSDSYSNSGSSSSSAAIAATDTTNSYDRIFHVNNINISDNSSPTPTVVVHQTTITPSLQPAPQPYKTLREQQVLQLQQEMQHPVGVRLQIRRKDCISSIALADAFESVWICGWNQREHPILYNTLHIGDQLLSVEGITVRSAHEAHQVLRTTNTRLYVTVVVRRVPHGRVYVIHREVDAQPLGLVRVGNTAIVQMVEDDGLAARNGLSRQAPTCDGLAFTSWVLTEINGRPLNLFFKEHEVRDRLNAVGREISILVQPLDLIKQLKKQLKSLRNYKDYILQ